MSDDLSALPPLIPREILFGNPTKRTAEALLRAGGSEIKCPARSQRKPQRLKREQWGVPLLSQPQHGEQARPRRAACCEAMQGA